MGSIYFYKKKLRFASIVSFSFSISMDSASVLLNMSMLSTSFMNFLCEFMIDFNRSSQMAHISVDKTKKPWD